MFALILTKVEASNEVLGEINSGLSQFSYTVLSYAVLIKNLEAHLLALST